MSVVALPASGKAESYLQGIVYLSGAVRREVMDPMNDRLGVLFTPLMHNRPTDPIIHAHDNGVFSEWKSGGKKPFSLDAFLAHLDDFSGIQHKCLFAVAPDVIGRGWWASLQRSIPVLPMIRQRGYRAALVAQNGLEHFMGRVPWDDFDVLFLGGGQDERYAGKGNPKGEWKLSPGAARLVAEARRRGKDAHMGRVNSLKRLRYAQSIGCTSADGTIIAFGPDVRTPEVQGWARTVNEGAGHVVTTCYVCKWKVGELAAMQRIPYWLAAERTEAYIRANYPAGHNPHTMAPPSSAPSRPAALAA